MKKINLPKTAFLLITSLIGISTSVTSFAGTTQKGIKGEWKRDNVGWWWQYEDGTWPSNTNVWIDGNDDGFAECYYFDEAGYMLANTTTPHSGYVNADGAYCDLGRVLTVETDEYLQKLKESRLLYIEDSVPVTTYKHSEGKDYNKSISAWVSSLVNNDNTAMINGGYTKGISNIALDLSQHSLSENNGKYSVESVLWFKENHQNWLWVKYKDLPLIVSYGAGSYNHDSYEVYEIEDISVNRNAIIKDYSDPYSYLGSEKVLREKGFFTISGGVQFVNDDELQNVLIRFYQSRNACDYLEGKVQVTFSWAPFSNR